MELTPDGVMLMAPPATFREGGSVQSGVAYSIDGARFQTNLFQQLCNSIGAYSWVLDGGILTLDAGRGRLRAAACGAWVVAVDEQVNVLPAFVL